MDKIKIACLNCKKELVQTSQRARVYCDDKCRISFKRSKSIPNKKVDSEQVDSEQIHSEQPIPNKKTDKKKDNGQLASNGQPFKPCQYCKYPVTEQEYGSIWNLVSTCYDCVSSRQKISRSYYPIHSLYPHDDYLEITQQATA